MLLHDNAWQRCRVQDITSQPDSEQGPERAKNDASLTGIQLTFPDAPSNEEQQAQPPHMQHVLQGNQPSAEAAPQETALPLADLKSNLHPDVLIRAEPSAAIRHTDIHDSSQHAAPAAGAVKGRHVKFSQVLAKSPTAVKALPAPSTPTDSEWTVIQSDGSYAEYASRTGSETSLVRVKSQVAQGQIADMPPQDAPQQEHFVPAGKSFTGKPVQGKAGPPSRQKLTVKVPTTGAGPPCPLSIVLLVTTLCLLLLLTPGTERQLQLSSYHLDCMQENSTPLCPQQRCYLLFDAQDFRL